MMIYASKATVGTSFITRKQLQYIYFYEEYTDHDVIPNTFFEAVYQKNLRIFFF